METKAKKVILVEANLNAPMENVVNPLALGASRSSMKIYLVILLCAFQAIAIPSLKAQDIADTSDVRGVIEMAIVAMGGKDYVRTIKTLYTDMVVESDSKKVHWITKTMYPNKRIFEVVDKNKVVYKKCFDGSREYEIVNDSKIASEGDLSDKRKQRHVIEELDYLNKKLWKIELQDDKNINGEDCYKVMATSAGGTVKYLYYSKRNFHKMEEDVLDPDTKTHFKVSIYGKYAKYYEKFSYYTTIQTDNNPMAKLENLYVNQKVAKADFKD